MLAFDENLIESNHTLSHLESQLMKRCIKIGAMAGFLSGIIVFLGYAMASWWVCSSLRDCPGSWVPYVVIFTIGVAALTLLGALSAAILRKLYELTRVDGPSP